MSRPLLVMLAGPNGAGKSTYYHTKLAHIGLPFLNADVLAQQQNIGAYEAAAEVAKMREELRRHQKPFITETVLSDPVGEKVSFLRQSSDQGYDVRLIFIGIDSPAMSLNRVRERVKAGGHDVPVDKIMARYERTLANLERAIQVLPWVNLVDNSSYQHPHRLLAKFRNGQLAFRYEGEIPGWCSGF